MDGARSLAVIKTDVLCRRTDTPSSVWTALVILAALRFRNCVTPDKELHEMP